MKNLLSFFLLLTCFYSYTQDRCSVSIIQDDFGGYQFYNEIVQILDLAKKRKIPKVEFNLKEFNNENDSMDIDITTLICNYTSDTTLTVLKHFNDGQRCFLWSYDFFIKHNIYILKKSNAISPKLTKKFNCDDTNKKYHQIFKSDWTIKSKNDSIIIDVKEKTFTYRLKLQDTLYYKNIFSDSNTYYLDSKNRCIGINQDYKITYAPNDTVKTTTLLDDGVAHLTTQVQNLEEVSRANYVINQIKITKFSDFDKTSKESYELKYSLNKKNLPIRLEILKSANHKVKGSIMTVKY